MSDLTIGGTTTIIGDPPNIIIANNVDIAPHVTFLNFTAHVTIGIFPVLVVAWLWIWKFHSHTLVRDPAVRIKAEMKVWHDTLSRLDETDASQVLSPHHLSLIFRPK